jgi:hypothetical protein
MIASVEQFHESRDQANRSTAIAVADKASLPAVQKNKSRNNLDSVLHEPVISGDIAKNLSKTKDLLITQPRKSVTSIFASIASKISNVAKDLNKDGLNGNKNPMAQYGLLIASAGFGLFALTSTLSFFKSLWAGDNSPKLIKAGDAAVKWLMALGIGGAVVGSKKFNISKSGALIGGTFISFLLSQASKFYTGENSLLGRLSSITGSDKVLKAGMRDVAGLSTLNSQNTPAGM